MLRVNTHFDSDGDNSAQSVIQRSGQVYHLEVSNPNGSAAWIQLFDLVTGDVTVGTTTPKQSFQIPANGHLHMEFYNPVHFENAITYACTTGATNGTDPGTGLAVNIGYAG